MKKLIKTTVSRLGIPLNLKIFKKQLADEQVYRVDGEEFALLIKLNLVDSLYKMTKMIQTIKKQQV
jgi:hypothetical protein